MSSKQTRSQDWLAVLESGGASDKLPRHVIAISSVCCRVSGRDQLEGAWSKKCDKTNLLSISSLSLSLSLSLCVCVCVCLCVYSH